jgi:hypothetical protein
MSNIKEKLTKKEVVLPMAIATVVGALAVTGNLKRVIELGDHQPAQITNPSHHADRYP